MPLEIRISYAASRVIIPLCNNAIDRDLEDLRNGLSRFFWPVGRRIETDSLLGTDDGRYFYQAIDQLPEACLDGGLPIAGDPDFNGDIVGDFELLWHAFNSFYPYFTLHDVDWDAAYETLRGQINATTSPGEMMDFVADILGKTEDVHVEINVSEDIFFNPDIRVRGIVEELLSQFENQEEFDDFNDFALFQIDEVFPQQIQTLYLDQEGAFRPLEDEPVRYSWGTLGKAGHENIGYLSVSSFSGLEPTLIEEKQALDQVMGSLQDTDGLVIDIRNNGGGSFNLAR